MILAARIMCSYTTEGTVGVKIDIPDDTPESDFDNLILKYAREHIDELVLPDNDKRVIKESFKIEDDREIIKYIVQILH